MPKVSVHLNMKGVDIREMMAQAKEKMADVAGSDVKFKITEMEMRDYGDDMATKQGMARLYYCDMTLEANIPD
jgi:ribosomal protein L11